MYIYTCDPCFAVKGKPSCFKLCFGFEKILKGVELLVLFRKDFSFENIQLYLYVSLLKNFARDIFGSKSY